MDEKIKMDENGYKYMNQRPPAAPPNVLHQPYQVGAPMYPQGYPHMYGGPPQPGFLPPRGSTLPPGVVWPPISSQPPPEYIQSPVMMQRPPTMNPIHHQIPEGGIPIDPANYPRSPYYPQGKPAAAAVVNKQFPNTDFNSNVYKVPADVNMPTTFHPNPPPPNISSAKPDAGNRNQLPTKKTTTQQPERTGDAAIQSNKKAVSIGKSPGNYEPDEDEAEDIESENNIEDDNEVVEKEAKNDPLFEPSGSEEEEEEEDGNESNFSSPTSESDSDEIMMSRKRRRVAVGGPETRVTRSQSSDSRTQRSRDKAYRPTGFSRSERSPVRKRSSTRLTTTRRVNNPISDSDESDLSLPSDNDTDYDEMDLCQGQPIVKKRRVVQRKPAAKRPGRKAKGKAAVTQAPGVYFAHSTEIERLEAILADDDDVDLSNIFIWKLNEELLQKYVFVKGSKNFEMTSNFIGYFKNDLTNYVEINVRPVYGKLVSLSNQLVKKDQSIIKKLAGLETAQSAPKRRGRKPSANKPVQPPQSKGLRPRGRPKKKVELHSDPEEMVSSPQNKNEVAEIMTPVPLANTAPIEEIKPIKPAKNEDKVDELTPIEDQGAAPAPIEDQGSTPALIEGQGETPVPKDLGAAPAPIEDQGSATAPIKDLGAAPDPIEGQGAPLAPIEDQGAAPDPNEDQGTTPAPIKDQDTAPAPIKDQDTAPAPIEEQGAALAPIEDQGAAPAPNEDQGTTPVVIKDQDTAPAPIENQDTAPALIEDQGAVPDPIVDQGTAMVPVEDQDEAPAHIEDTVTTPAPIEGQGAKLTPSEEVIPIVTNPEKIGKLENSFAEKADVAVKDEESPSIRNQEEDVKMEDTSKVESVEITKTEEVAKIKDDSAAILVASTNNGACESTSLVESKEQSKDNLEAKIDAEEGSDSEMLKNVERLPDVPPSESAEDIQDTEKESEISDTLDLNMAAQMEVVPPDPISEEVSKILPAVLTNLKEEYSSDEETFSETNKISGEESRPLIPEISEADYKCYLKKMVGHEITSMNQENCRSVENTLSSMTERLKEQLEFKPDILDDLCSLPVLCFHDNENDKETEIAEAEQHDKKLMTLSGKKYDKGTFQPLDNEIQEKKHFVSSDLEEKTTLFHSLLHHRINWLKKWRVTYENQDRQGATDDNGTVPSSDIANEVGGIVNEILTNICARDSVDDTAKFDNWCGEMFSNLVGMQTKAFQFFK